ncbi:hypothetical protein AJ78_04285 [Emergomyces pasteurianus Ep9510]|uniref:Uncharacterized protein n=1 Tax=Emergomyces pasteurianus Ep9510 TaxID=1447872 RepID=A0A1J9QHP7_9EURO|nr:hypothetical protein AJ78_04285 [Emergomyces pasteurianus Ep9510]
MLHPDGFASSAAEPPTCVTSSQPTAPKAETKPTPTAVDMMGAYKVGTLPLYFNDRRGQLEDDAAKNEAEHGLYSLDHAVLNLPSLTPDEMWMNMGYWKNTTSFPSACGALLDKILQTAGLNSTAVAESPIASTTGVGLSISQSACKPKRRKRSRDTKTPVNGKKRVILDVGFGCGAQTLYLMRKKVAARKGLGDEEVEEEEEEVEEDDDKIRVNRQDNDDKTDGVENASCIEPLPGSNACDSSESVPLFQHYIGITIEKMQCGFARSRVAEAATRNRNDPVNKDGPSEMWGKKQDQSIGGTVELFCADAAKPYAWSEEIQRSISTAFGEGKYAEEERGLGGNPAEERYVLGLDTLYHFSPSREELFEYSHSTLQATLLAFDLFLPAKPRSSSPFDNVKRSLNTFALRCLTPALSAPFSNFVTIAEYKRLLEKAGYGLDDITIEDITDDVFPGLAKFFEKRIQEMTALGLEGFTKWRISGWLFRWLASGQVLRAGVVVARWKGSAL